MVVRSIFWGKDSVGPRSVVDIAKWDNVNCTCSGIVTMWLTMTKANRVQAVGIDL